MSSFWLGFEKEAASKNDEQKSKERAQGLAAIGGGGYGAMKAKPLITGRTTLYHGTHNDAAKDILKNGLKPGGAGIADMLRKDLKAGDYVYMTPNKEQAHAYARQAAGLQSEFKKNPGKDRETIVRDYAQSFERRTGSHGHKGQVLKGSVPLWKHEVFKNPELRGAKNGQEFAKAMAKENPLNGVRSPFYYHVMHKSLDVPTFKHVGPENFKNSPHYQRHSWKEMRQYAKARPKHLAGGLALGAASLGAAAFGSKRIHDTYKDK